MKLSIIIVNYNVKHFLKQCLNSSLLAARSIQYEIICIDNNSIDGSTEMIENEYPNIQLIKNKNNVGFSKACNQGIKISKGEYILILNPDTVLKSDSLSKPLQFMDEHAEAGSLGVKMVDGNGKYLPESKRGLPTPAAAFYKMTGISKVFYPSKTFGKYHLDHLDKNEIHEVHVLTGAFMLIRKSALEKIGLFDEEYFMYGEDIDLSHRIILGRYKNYYYPKTSIIHYKGESTKKESMNYVFNFYKAMLIFAKKYHSKQNAYLFSLLIKLAIFFRAFLAITNRLTSKILLPLLDLGIIILGLYQITGIWAQQITYPNGGSYPDIFYQLVIPIYGIIWIVANFLSGSYEKTYKPKNVLIGILSGTTFILLAYSLLPESSRFSRSIILLGSLWGIFSLLIIRWIFKILGWFKTGMTDSKRILIIGQSSEAERVTNILQQNKIKTSFIGQISPNQNVPDHSNSLGDLSQIPKLIQSLNIQELIFCSKDLSYQKIITEVIKLQSSSLVCKIAPEDGIAIIGSNSITSTEDLYFQKINSIGNYVNKRKKRILDLFISIILLLSLPINLFFIQNPFRYIKNIFRVLFGYKTWVSYHPNEMNKQEFVNLKDGILFITDGIKGFQNQADSINQANINYIKNYNIYKDLHVLYYGYKKLGR